jgi:hypothetical protein
MLALHPRPHPTSQQSTARRRCGWHLARWGGRSCHRAPKPLARLAPCQVMRPRIASRAASPTFQQLRSASSLRPPCLSVLTQAGRGASPAGGHAGPEGALAMEQTHCLTTASDDAAGEHRTSSTEHREQPARPLKHRPCFTITGVGALGARVPASSLAALAAPSPDQRQPGRLCTTRRPVRARARNCHLSYWRRSAARALPRGCSHRPLSVICRDACHWRGFALPAAPGAASGLAFWLQTVCDSGGLRPMQLDRRFENGRAADKLWPACLARLRIRVKGSGGYAAMALVGNLGEPSATALPSRLPAPAASCRQSTGPP